MHLTSLNSYQHVYFTVIEQQRSDVSFLFQGVSLIR